MKRIKPMHKPLIVTKVTYKEKECWKVGHNYFSCARYTKGEARAMVDTLPLCYDCLDCEHCFKCVDCVECINCKESTSCRSCRSCWGCSECNSCNNCFCSEGCHFCDFCIKCIEATFCKNCVALKYRDNYHFWNDDIENFSGNEKDLEKYRIKTGVKK